MNNITFKQFIYTYNFRYVDSTKQYEDDQLNTTTIRIYPPSEAPNRRSDWFEFGIYDYSQKEFTWRNCKRILSEEILNSYIQDIQYNEDFHNVVTIYLTKEKECDD